MCDFCFMNGPNSKKFWYLLVISGLLVLPLQPLVFAHKPIDSDGKNNSFDKAIEIPNHLVSWVIYENIVPGGIKYYKFHAMAGDPLYTQIVIPKLQGLEKFTPTLVLVGPGTFSNSTKIDRLNFQAGVPSRIYNYMGPLPSKEFYEPFGQATYWNRQEVRTTLSHEGTYYLVIFDTQGNGGKYSLAIGEVEDFKPLDFLTILPAAWFKTKLFFDDYASFSVGIAVFVGIFSLIGFLIFLIIKKKLR